MVTMIKEFFSENPTAKLGEQANKFAEEHELKILQIQSNVLPLHSYSDGRGNTNMRVLTVLFETK